MIVKALIVDLTYPYFMKSLLKIGGITPFVRKLFNLAIRTVEKSGQHRDVARAD
jgi:hypothetical protein